MFSLFNINKKQAVAVQTKNQLIDKIHTDFYTEVNNILNKCSVEIELTQEQDILSQKAQRMLKLGFSNTKEVQETINKIKPIHLQNQQNKELKEAIIYFQNKYPTYKFITEDSISKLCTKYNLVKGLANEYIGDIPETNLQHIENFKIKDEDCCYYKDHVVRDEYRHRDYINYQDFIYYQKMELRRPGFSILKEGFSIIAPQKDFDLKNKVIINNTINKVVEDPIVVFPVLYNMKKYYLIVTAWGQEASDNLVINPKLN